MRSKIICLSDLHLMNKKPVGRKDNVPETLYKKMSFVYDYAVENDIQLVLIAGDIFDTPRSWTLMSEYYDFFMRYKDKGVDTFVVAGQHDLYGHNYDLLDKTALGMLAKGRALRILPKEPYRLKLYISGTFVMLVGVSYGFGLPEVGLDDSCFNIVVMHYPIIPDEWNPWWFQKYMTLSELVEYGRERNWNLVVCGDIHKKFFYKDKKITVVNTGPLLRRELTEDMRDHKPCFFVYDLNTREGNFMEIDHLPCEEVLDFESKDRELALSRSLDEFITALKSKNFKRADFYSNLKFLLENEDNEKVKGIIDKIISGGKVI